MRKFLIPLLLLAGLIAYLYSKQTHHLVYPDAKAKIAADEVASATLTESHLRIVTKDGEWYESRLPPEDPALIAALEGAKVPYSVEEDLLGCAGSFLPTVVFFAILFYLLPIPGGRSIPGLGGNKPKREAVTFKDVAGYAEVKAELEDVIQYLRDPRGYGRLGARAPKGVLLEGPPGTGKTFLARAVAGEAGVAFIDTTGSSFGSIFISVSGAQVRKMFEQARAMAPCIIFIDEIDALARKRRGAGGSGSAAEQEFDNTLNTLLTEMDGFRSSDGVVVIAATNRADVLDAAVLRPGRFDRHVQVGLPDQAARHAIIAQYATKVTCATDVNLEHLAVLSVGLAGAHLENLVNEAAVIATRRKGISVTMEDFQQALERARGGVETARRLNEEDRRRVAVHEIGHALAAAAAGIGRKVRKVTILGRGRALGYNLIIPEEGDDLIQTRTELTQEICSLLGGTAAEQVVFGERSSGAAADLEQVERIVTMMVSRLGLGTTLPYRVLEPGGTYPPELVAALEAEKTQISRECYERVVGAITSARPLLDRMVDTLLTQDTLNGEELQGLLAQVQAIDIGSTPS